MWNLAKSKTDAPTIVGLVHKKDLFLDEIAARFSLKIYFKLTKERGVFSSKDFLGCLLAEQ